jgi:protein SCO1
MTVSLWAKSSHRVEGIVIEVDRPQGVMVVSHKAVEGFMPAMTMPFRADPPAALDSLQPGARIVFELHDGKARKIQLLDLAPVADFKIPEPANRLALGAEVPDVEGLLDQDNHPVRVSDFRGKVVAVQFIYTRCPLPEVCPRQASQFAYLHRKYPEAVLLTVTLDPKHDTPAELKSYAQRWRTAGPNWRFVTSANEDRIQQFGGLFGIVFWPDEGVITHTSSTAIVGRDGRLRAVVRGSSHSAAQIADLLASQLR